MNSEPHGNQHDSVEMPEPTVAPLVLALGMALFAFGFIAGPLFNLVGLVMLLYGLGMWINNLLPGRGHMHEPFAAPENRPQPVKQVLGNVQELRPGMPGYRVRLPEKVHPISAGIKGGLVGGAIIPIPAMIWGLFSGKGIFFPAYLLVGMVLPGVSDKDLSGFHFDLLLIGVVIHFVTCLIVGMVYGVLLPTLPEIPQGMAWGALLAPILWSGATFVGMTIVNKDLRDGVNWTWFIVSQFIFGVVMTLVVTSGTGLHPTLRGVAGGLLGGALMPIPAVMWSLGTGKGFFYPVNLLASGIMAPGLTKAELDQLKAFRLDWLIVASVLHLVVSAGIGILFALVLTRLKEKPIPAPFAWGGLVLPLLWTGGSYGLMGVVNPLLQEQVSWPWFIVSQFIFGMVAAVIVIRTEQVVVPPAGKGGGQP